MKYERENYDISKLDPHWTDWKIVQMIGSNKKILEIGCANGYYGKYLKNNAGCKLWGIEIDPQLAEQARPYYEKIIIHDIQDKKIYEQFDKDSFDVIICSNVLEHIAKPQDVLHSLKPLLKQNGGYFVMAIPNVANFKVRLKLLFGNFGPDQGILAEDHLKFMTIEKIRKLVSDAGLQMGQLTFDSDTGIPFFDGILRRLPPWGPKFLDWFYGLCPTLFAFQFIFVAKLKN